MATVQANDVQGWARDGLSSLHKPFRSVFGHLKMPNIPLVFKIFSVRRSSRHVQKQKVTVMHSIM